MSRIYITPEELADLEQYAGQWAADVDSMTAATGIGPMHHDHSRLLGLLHRIRAGSPPMALVDFHRAALNIGPDYHGDHAAIFGAQRCDECEAAR